MKFEVSFCVSVCGCRQLRPVCAGAKQAFLGGALKQTVPKRTCFYSVCTGVLQERRVEMFLLQFKALQIYQNRTLNENKHMVGKAD